MMERILALACLCIFYVGMVSSVQVPYFSITENSTNCSVLSTIGSKVLDATVTIETNYSVIYPLVNENSAESVRANVSYYPSSKDFQIIVSATVYNSTQVETFKISGNNVDSWNNSNKNDVIKSIYVRGSQLNNSDSSNSTYLCFDMVLLYKNDSNSNTLTNVGLACWTGDATTLTSKDQLANSTNKWTRAIGKDLCSAAYSNMQLTPLFALAISFIAIFINKT